MVSKRNKQSKGESGAAEEGKQMITDPRFSSAHTDPRFRRVPRRESKVTIDSRFQGVLTDTASAPVDKRGKRRRRGSEKDSLKEYYRIDKDEQKKKQKEESGDESEGEEELMALKAEALRRKSEQSSEEDSEEESKSDKKLDLKLASSDEESDESAESEEDVSEEEEEEDTDEEDEAMYEDDGPEVEEENIANIEKETHRLAIVNMDWRYVSAKDLYVVFNSFLPKDGRLLSVAVYPTEFGLERMKEEEIHGPAIDGNKDNGDEEDDEEEEEDEDLNNERLRDYEKSRLKYYFAVAECDSSATADYLYKSCDGIEFERSSNKLDLRFIPDSMEFKHPARDIATEAPANYQGLDFQSKALQLSRVEISWDEDEPHRMKTLNQKFNPDQLAELELKEFLASDESESDDDEGKRKETYRALMESGDVVDSDKDEEEENDQDMEVTFNTGLEDLSKKILEKKDKKSETVWETYLREKREKKKARRSKQKDGSSSDDDDDDDDEDDDYNVDDHKKKIKKKKKVLEEKAAADERSIAELELIVADENGGGLKGYNIKGKGKKRSKEMAEEKIPSADPDDPRFAAAYTDPDYALDPTNPQFKRSATYVKQLAHKHREDPRSNEQVKAKETKAKEESTTDGMVGSKKRSFADSATVKSLKLKMQQKGSEKKNEGTGELAQRVKKKAKALSNK